jgi:hypothetical protein
MAVVVEKILVIVRDFLVGWFVVRVYGHYASASHCLTVNRQDGKGCGWLIIRGSRRASSTPADRMNETMRQINRKH